MTFTVSLIVTAILALGVLYAIRYTGSGWATGN